MDRPTSTVYTHPLFFFKSPHKILDLGRRPFESLDAIERPKSRREGGGWTSVRKGCGRASRVRRFLCLPHRPHPLPSCNPFFPFFLLCLPRFLFAHTVFELSSLDRTTGLFTLSRHLPRTHISKRVQSLQGLATLYQRLQGPPYHTRFARQVTPLQSLANKYSVTLLGCKPQVAIARSVEALQVSDVVHKI